jgi:enoyl-CoA hydratase
VSEEPRWRQDLRDQPGSLFDGIPVPTQDSTYRTMTYEVTGRIARITFNRPEHGNAITPDTPIELAHAVERADLDPRVHVICLSGRGTGFCGGYDLSLFAEQATSGMGAEQATSGMGAEQATSGMGAEQNFGAEAEPRDTEGTVLDPRVQGRNHDPSRVWDPMVDYAMMSRFNRGFASLLHANKPTVAKLHGFCVAGGTDIALFADLVIAAADTKIGYPPTRVWGVPAAGMWAHRVGDQRAKRLLLTGDTINGREAVEWGLAIEAPEPDQLDARTEILLERIASLPVNQLIMVKLALNAPLLAQGVATSGMVSTVFDGIARHTAEGHAFVHAAAEDGFRAAVRQRDEPFGDAGRTVHRG